MKKLLVGLIAFLFAPAVNAQYSTEIDRLVKNYEAQKVDSSRLRSINEVSVKLLEFDKQKALNLARIGIKLTSTSKDQKQIANAYFNYGYLLRYANKRDSSTYYFSLSKEICENIKDTSRLAAAYFNLAGNYYIDGNTGKALETMQQAISFASSANDTATWLESLRVYGLFQGKSGKKVESLNTSLELLKVAIAYNDSAILGKSLSAVSSGYRACNNYSIAKDYIEEAIKVNNHLGNNVTLFIDWNNLAGIQHQLGNYQDALKSHQKSLTLLDTNTRPRFYTSVLLEMSSNYFELGDLKKSEQMARDALDFSVIKKYPTKIAEAQYQLARCAFEEGKVDESLEYLEAGLIEVERKNIFNLKEGYYNLLSKGYSKKQNFEKAYQYEHLLSVHKDSIYKKEYAQGISDAEIRYQMDRKNMEIEFLTKKAKIDTRLKQKQQIITAVSVFVMLLMGLFGFLLFKQAKLRQKLKMEQFRNRIAADLHDNMGSTLSSIGMYSEVIKQRLGNEVPETEHMLDIVTQSSQELIESMNDIVWTINPKNNTIQSLLARIRELAAELCEAKNIKFTFKGESIENLTMDMESAQNVYLILKEGINNALKYSECNEIILAVRLTGKRFDFEINDDGKGFDKNAIKQGNGMRTMNQRMKDIGGDLEIESSDMGTTIKGSLAI